MKEAETEGKSRNRSCSRTRSRSHSHSHSHSRSGSRSSSKHASAKSKSKEKKSKHKKSNAEPEIESAQTTPFPFNEGLLTEHANSETDLITALNLISDSIAQQRQQTASSILHHPLYYLLLLTFLKFIYSRVYQYPEDIVVVILIWAFCALLTLGVVRYVTAGYLDEAERVGRWSWLFGRSWVTRFKEDFVAEGNNVGLPIVDSRFLKWIPFQDMWVRVPGGDPAIAERWFLERGFTSSKTDIKSDTKEKEKEMENVTEKLADPGITIIGTTNNNIEAQIADGWLRDTIFVTRFKGKIIATLVLRVLLVDLDIVSTLKRLGPSRSSPRVEAEPVYNTARNKAVIRAWTVQQIYRGHGVGKEILQFAVEYAKEKGLSGPEFAVDHANSLRTVPGFLYHGVEAKERRGKELLKKMRASLDCEMVVDM